MRIQQFRSIIRTTQRQRRIMQALGLRRLGHIKDVQDVPSIRGMVEKVSHLVRILSKEASS